MVADYIALAVILIGSLVLFWTQLLRTDLTALLVTVGLIFPWPHPDGVFRGILAANDAFAGFGSPAVVMVTSMFIFGAAMVRAGAAEFVASKIFKRCSHSESLLQLAILCVSTLCSMFINDTTVVVIFLPVIIAICKERNLSPGRYLLWAAYGSLLGGQWTLIGTRSNIVISDFLRTETGRSFGFFDLTPIAATVFIVCAGFLTFAGRKWLPTAQSADEAQQSLSREYLTEVMVTPSSNIVGKQLEQIDLFRRSDVALLEVIREDQGIPPSGRLRIEPSDVFVLQGPVALVSQLLQSADLTFKEELRINNRTLRSVDLVTVEALIGPRSDYVDHTLKQANFREDYGFTALGISRQGATLELRPLATRLAFGDSLLLLGHITGLPRLQRNQNIIVLGHTTVPTPNPMKIVITLSILLFIIGTAISGVISPTITIPLAAALVVLLKCIDLEAAYDSVDWQAVVTTAGMIPFGLALEKTGAVKDLSHWTVSSLHGFPPTMLLGVLLLLALILTHFIDNSATAIILAPLGYELARELHVDPYPFLIGLAICISASFSIPIAHESTILVMGPGRYQFKHYLKIGGILALLTWLITLWLTPLVWRF